jgi:WD40 repeat protein
MSHARSIAILAVALAANGPSLAAASRDTAGERIRAGAVVRFAAGGHQPGHLEQPGALSPDGKLMALVTDSGILDVYDTASGRLRTRVGRLARKDAAAFSPDGKRLIALLADGAVRMVDPLTGRQHRLIRAEDNAFTSATFSPTSRYVAFATDDRGIVLCDAATGGLHFSVPAADHGDKAAAFSPDGERLATIGRGGQLNVWDLGTRTSVVTVPAFRCGAFSPDGKHLLACAGEQRVFLVEIPSGRVRLRLSDENLTFTSAAFSSDSRVLATMSADGGLRLWDPVSGKFRSQHRASAEGSLAVDFSPRAGVLAPWLTGDQTLVCDLVIQP